MHKNPRQQRGVALIVTLILLVVITMLAVTSSRSAMQSELLARSARAQSVAFQAAEAALADAKNDMGFVTSVRGDEIANFPENAKLSYAADSGNCNSGDTNGFAGICSSDVGGATHAVPAWDRLLAGLGTDLGTMPRRAGFAAPPQFPSSADDIAGVADQPSYVIELRLDTGPGKALLGGAKGGTPSVVPIRVRATALGIGPTVDTRVILQETFKQK